MNNATAVYITICRELAEDLSTMAAKLETSEYDVTFWDCGRLEKLQGQIESEINDWVDPNYDPTDDMDNEEECAAKRMAQFGPRNF